MAHPLSLAFTIKSKHETTLARCRGASSASRSPTFGAKRGGKQVAGIEGLESG